MSEIRDGFALPKQSLQSQNAADYNVVLGNAKQPLISNINYFAFRTIFNNL